MLNGYLSEDAQEPEVALGSYDNTGEWNEDSDRSIIAYYSNYDLAVLPGYVFTWTDDDNLLNDVNSPNPTFIPPAAGDYEFELTVEDPDGLSAGVWPGAVAYTHLTLPTNREV